MIRVAKVMGQVGGEAGADEKAIVYQARAKLITICDIPRANSVKLYVGAGVCAT